MQFPGWELNPDSLHWECGILATRPPGKSQVIIFHKAFLLRPLPKVTLHLWTPVCACSPQSYPTLCDPVDCSLLGSSVHGILQARILEWVAKPSSRRSSRPRDQTHISYISCIGRRVLYACTVFCISFMLLNVFCLYYFFKCVCLSWRVTDTNTHIYSRSTKEYAIKSESPADPSQMPPL